MSNQAFSIEETLEYYKRLVKAHTQRLRELEIQRASFGLNVPAHISIEINDINEKIRAGERKIVELEQLIYQSPAKPFRQRKLKHQNGQRFIWLGAVLLLGISMLFAAWLFLNPQASTTQPSSTQTSEAQTAKSNPDEFIRSYYNQVISRSYDNAFAMLSDNFKRESHCCKADGSFDDSNFVSFWNTINQVSISNVNILSVADQTATISYTLHYIRDNGTDVTSDLVVALLYDTTVNQWKLDKVLSSKNY